MKMKYTIYKKLIIWSILWVIVICSQCSKYSWIGIIFALPFGIISIINYQ